MSADPGLRHLSQPIAEASPCGEDLEDTPLLASFDAFRLFGQVAAFDPAPDWGAIRSKSLEALARSRDLRVLAHLAAATIRTDGLLAFLDILGVTAQWLEAYWDHVYPRVDEDAVLRRNALNCLSDRVATIDALRRAPLITHRQLGAVTLRDIDFAAGQIVPAEGDGHLRDGTQINAVFDNSAIEDVLALRAAIDEAVAALRRIETVMVAQARLDAAPSFEGLTTYLTKVQRFVRDRAAAHPNASSPEPHVEIQSPTPAGPSQSVGVIRSREDAIRALDAVSAYFRRNEPSSPVPLFIDRAKRLVAKDFLEILADVAPDAVTQAKLAGGVRERE
jgi:type VI secretion system protein ImpA